MDRWINRFKLNHSIWVFVPSDDSRQVGRKIKTAIEKNYKSPEFYFHLKNGSHIKALNSHMQHEYFASLDIENFFGNINKSRITRVLKIFFSYDEAREYANWSVVRNPDENSNESILPFGFVQSPALASLCLDKSKLGRVLRNINNLDVSVSVYMDDIILSSNDKALLYKSLKKVEEASEKSKFPLNKDKKNNPSNKVTVFNIDLSRGKLQINNKRIKEFQSAYEKTGLDEEKKGILNYIKTINPIQEKQFIDKINKI